MHLQNTFGPMRLLALAGLAVPALAAVPTPSADPWSPAVEAWEALSTSPNLLAMAGVGIGIAILMWLFTTYRNKNKVVAGILCSAMALTVASFWTAGPAMPATIDARMAASSCAEVPVPDTASRAKSPVEGGGA